MDFKTDDLHADLVICAFQSLLNASFLLLISLSSFALFFFSLFFFSYRNGLPPALPPLFTPPSHDTARGIIIGYVQRSMLTFNPGLWDRRGPRSPPEHKEWQASGGIVAEGR